MRLSSKGALWLFIAMVVTLVALGAWWIIFMAQLVDEKVDIAQELGARQEYIDQIQAQEVRRQIMVGMEGITFLLLILGGAWLIYRALVRTEELKFHQQNFLMAVTHELKTPLASIRLYLDSLQSTKIDPARKEKIVPRMQEDVDRLGRMVENILDAGRFERSGYHVNRTMLDLSNLVESRVAELCKAPTTVSLKVEKEITPGIQFYGDRAALGRAIDAILENSVKYHDSKEIVLRTKLFIEGKQIILSIADNGMGFERREANALFERFYRVGDEMTRQRPGTGLGLYLCREIIRAHGGKVKAFSDGPGKGATFTIELKKNHEDNPAR